MAVIIAEIRLLHQARPVAYASSDEIADLRYTVSYVTSLKSGFF